MTRSVHPRPGRVMERNRPSWIDARRVPSVTGAAGRSRTEHVAHGGPMHRERSQDRAPGKPGSIDTSGRQIGPGKRTLTEGLAVQRRAAGPDTELAAGGEAATAPAPLPPPSRSEPRP